MKRKPSATVLFIAAAMLAWAAAAGAVDGTIEINDAKVIAAGGYPGKITGHGSFRLTGNLKPPGSSDGIDVSATNVTIDLNGFAIIGTGPSDTGNGINASGQDDVTVENGTVTGFNGNGVAVGTFGIVRNVHADKNGVGIVGGLNSVIEGSTANNSSGGMGCSGVCVISGNTVNGNFADGIDCLGNACMISGNTANANGSAGIDCVGSGCLISGNTIFNNNQGIVANNGTTGYGGNVLKNTTTDVTGGTSIGHNLCSGTAC